MSKVERSVRVRWNWTRNREEDPTHVEVEAAETDEEEAPIAGVDTRDASYHRFKP